MAPLFETLCCHWVQSRGPSASWRVLRKAQRELGLVLGIFEYSPSIVPPLLECHAGPLPARSHGATLSVWFQFAVRRSLRVGSEAFGTSGLRRSFRPGLNASSAAIQAMFGPLGQESLSCGSTTALVTGSIFNSGVRCWSFFSPVVTKAPRRKILNLHRILLVTTRRMNDGDEDGTL